jgi:hypothetical protein
MHLIAVLFTLLCSQSAHAWLAPGHAKATHTAMAALQRSDMPAFFLAADVALARESTMPDAMRNRATEALYSAERSEHYFDLELIGEHDLPPTRAKFIAMCHEIGVEPDKVGYLPYAIVEQTQRLAVAFADYRARPNDPTIQARCLVIAGTLAHYAQDMAQPLHVTIHYNGRDQPGSGIHKRMDALLHRVDVRLDADKLELERHDAIAPQNMLLPLRALNAMVDTVYAMEADLPTDDPDWQPTEQIKQAARKHLENAAFFTCLCYLTAWDMSASIELPDWLDGVEP